MIELNELLSCLDKPRKSVYLQRKFGLSDVEIRKTIRDYVNEGVLICSSKKGFFIPKNEEDFKEGYYSIIKRIAPMIKRAKKLKEEFEKNFNKELQQELFI